MRKQCGDAGIGHASMSAPRVILTRLPAEYLRITRKHTPATEGPWPNSPKEVGDVCA